jgi:Flp pilus assembly protein TadD
VLLKDPDHVPALFSQAKLLEETGKKGEAKSRYQELLAKSENYAPALNNLAYLNVNGYGNAREGLRLAFLAARLNPSSPEVMDTLGYALLKNGRGNESQQILEKAYKLLPDNPTVSYHLALAYIENGAGKKAAPLLQRALYMGSFPEEEHARKLLSRSGN